MPPHSNQWTFPLHNPFALINLVTHPDQRVDPTSRLRVRHEPTDTRLQDLARDRPLTVGLLQPRRVRIRLASGGRGEQLCLQNRTRLRGPDLGRRRLRKPNPGCGVRLLVY